MAIFLYVIGVFVYLLLGLFFVGTEARWGFPFGYDSRFGVREILEKHPIKNILQSPILAVLYLIRLFVGLVMLSGVLFALGIWDFVLSGFRFNQKERYIYAEINKKGECIIKDAK